MEEEIDGKRKESTDKKYFSNILYRSTRTQNTSSVLEEGTTPWYWILHVFN